MHDIKLIRDNPAAFDAGLSSRGLEPLADKLLALDDQRHSAIAVAQTSQERRNAASKEIGAAMAAKDMARADGLKAEVAALKNKLGEAEAATRTAEAELKAALETIPNTPLADVPVGADEHGNIEYRRHGEMPCWRSASGGELIGHQIRELHHHHAEISAISDHEKRP